MGPGLRECAWVTWSPGVRKGGVASQGPLPPYGGPTAPPASALTGFLQGPEEHRSETLQEESQEETHRCKEPQAGRGAPAFHPQGWTCLL